MHNSVPYMHSSQRHFNFVQNWFNCLIQFAETFHHMPLFSITRAVALHYKRAVYAVLYNSALEVLRLCAI